MPYTAEQEKFVAGLSSGMYIYFKGDNQPYEVLRVYNYKDPKTGDDRKAVQFRIGAIDDPRAEVGQLDIDKININEKPFIRGKAADKEAGARRKGLRRFAAFASDLTKRGLGATGDALSNLTADPGNVEGGILPGKASSGSFGKVYQGVKKSFDASKYKDRY